MKAKALFKEKARFWSHVKCCKPYAKNEQTPGKNHEHPFHFYIRGNNFKKDGINHSETFYTRTIQMR